MAAALAGMVAGISRGKKAYLQYERQLSDAIARLATLRDEFKAAIDADAASYEAVVKAFKQAKASADGDAAVRDALKGATNVPLTVADKASEVGRIVESLKPITNPKMASDLTVASALARAAVEGALANVEINLEGLEDPDFVAQVRKKTAALEM
jgi:formiminotetrahydrofolate cyclodeaminase